eukprot:1590762-Prymnesium_polylepis.1
MCPSVSVGRTVPSRVSGSKATSPALHLVHAASRNHLLATTLSRTYVKRAIHATTVSRTYVKRAVHANHLVSYVGIPMSNEPFTQCLSPEYILFGNPSHRS